MLIKKLNNKKISINSFSILSILGIFILANLLEISIAIVPSSFVKIYLSKSSIIWVLFIIGLLTKYIVIRCLISWFCSFQKPPIINRYKPGRTLIVCLLMLISYRLIYNFGISHIFDFSRNSSVVTSTFNELFNFKILALITVLLVSPVYEEVIFRGLILNALRKRHSEVLSIVISAVLFSIVHLNLVQCVNTFLIGLILGLIYVKTESLYIVIFAHIFHNMLALKLPIFINGPKWLQITGSIFIISISLLVFFKSITYLFNHKTEIEND